MVAALQSANGEVGTRQPLAAAWEACRARGVPLVVDAHGRRWAATRCPTPTTCSSATPGRGAGRPASGCSSCRERTRWRRPGAASEAEFGRTDAEPVVPLVLAAAEAWQQTAADRDRRAIARARARRPGPDGGGPRSRHEVVGDPVDRLPHVVTFSCLFVDGEALVDELDRRGFAVASGSACTSSTLEPSHVLAAMGVLTHGNVRVTLPLAAAVSAASRAGGRRPAFCDELPDAVATVRAQLGTDRL